MTNFFTVCILATSALAVKLPNDPAPSLAETCEQDLLDESLDIQNK